MSMGYTVRKVAPDCGRALHMMSIGQVGPAGKAGDYYTHQDNYL
jgi:hypothetical protein